MRTVVSLALIGALWVQDDGWSRVMQLAPRADVNLELQTYASYRGAFRTADDQSITLVVGKKDRIVQRNVVRRVTVNRGLHHQKRNVLIGLALAFVVTAVMKCRAKGCDEASPLTFYPLAGVFTLVGALVPSGDGLEIYRAGNL